MASQLGGKDAAERIIDRYELTGGGAEAVQAIFAPPSGISTTLGIVGFFFLMLAVLSFARAVQRLFEQTWELVPLSVRNTANGLLWIGGLAVYLGRQRFPSCLAGTQPPRAQRGAARHTADGSCSSSGAGGCSAPERIPRQNLTPFAVLGSVLLALYSIGATAYIPRASLTRSPPVTG